MTVVTDTALIGIDWGTSALRAYRFDGEGTVVERRSGPHGILSIADGGFDAVFEATVADWPACPVVISGMITSRQGWVELPYLMCPAPVEALAGALRRHQTDGGREVHFVTGLAARDAAGIPDVMRGEETQILGAIADDDAAARLLVLPGTHSKWALVEGAEVSWFATFMTGEVFAVLKEHSILGRMMTGETRDTAAWARGVGHGLDDDSEHGGLLRRLFSARSLALFDELPQAGVASYLSGLLLGAEIREARHAFMTGAGPVLLLGSAALCDLYAAALALAGLAAERGPDDAAARGHWRIAAAAGLLT